VAAVFADEETIYTVARDNGVFVWRWKANEGRANFLGRRRAKQMRDAEGGADNDTQEGEEEDEAEEAAEKAEAALSAIVRQRNKAERFEAAGEDEDLEEELDLEDDDEEAEAEAEAEGARGPESKGAGSKRRRPATTDDSDEEEGGKGGEGADAARKAAAPRRPRYDAVKSWTSVLKQRQRHTVPAPFDTSAAAADLGLPKYSVLRGQWVLSTRDSLKPADFAKAQSAAFHRAGGLLVVGFSNGTFGLYTMPDCKLVHTLSISKHEIHASAVNASGEWLAFGSRTLGQLLVWEWKTETYILKQQGHFYDLNAVAYSPNGHLMATGGDDGKIKVWNTSSGFCFVTFSEHKAPVTALSFVGGKSGHGLAIVSASLDGTVRAFDLVRYRNFRTLSGPDASVCQYISLACDDAGEVICAGTMDPFSIHVWSLQTGKLLDVLTGHQGPVCSLSFSASAGLLASASWDKTVRLWDVFRDGTATETFRHGSDVLAVSWRPDGQQLASSTLDGHLHVWDAKRGVELAALDCRRDAEGGRKVADVRTAKNNAAGKCFTTISYTADGDCLLAGGRTKYICLYALGPRLLLKKWQLSHNRSLDGVLDKLNSKGLGEGGQALSLLNLEDPFADDPAVARKAKDDSLPGAKTGATSMARNARPEVRAKGMMFSPTGRSFAVASTEGLLVYSLDDSLVFDPIELGEDVTPEATFAALEDGHYARALLLALHLNEGSVIESTVERIPASVTPLVARTVPAAFATRLLEFVASKLMPGSKKSSPHLDFYIRWGISLIQSHARAFRERSAFFAGALRDLQRAFVAQRDSLARLCDANRYMLEFLSGSAAVFESDESARVLGVNGLDSERPVGVDPFKALIEANRKAQAAA
jgi:periodic tryptophan protein 2